MTEHRPAKAEAAINSGLHSPKFGASFCVTVFPVSHAANKPQVMSAGRSHEIHRMYCLDPSVGIGLPSASSKEFRCVSEHTYHQHAKEVAPRQSEQDTASHLIALEYPLRQRHKPSSSLCLTMWSRRHPADASRNFSVTSQCPMHRRTQRCDATAAHATTKNTITSTAAAGNL